MKSIEPFLCRSCSFRSAQLRSRKLHYQYAASHNVFFLINIFEIFQRPRFRTPRGLCISVPFFLWTWNINERCRCVCYRRRFPEIPSILLLSGSKHFEESLPAQRNGRLVQNPLNPPLKPKRVCNQAKVIESSGVFVSFGRVVKFHASHFSEVFSRYYISSPMRKAMQVDAK